MVHIRPPHRAAFAASRANRKANEQARKLALSLTLRRPPTISVECEGVHMRPAPPRTPGDRPDRLDRRRNRTSGRSRRQGCSPGSLACGPRAPHISHRASKFWITLSWWPGGARPTLTSAFTNFTDAMAAQAISADAPGSTCTSILRCPFFQACTRSHALTWRWSSSNRQARKQTSTQQMT